MVTILSLSNKRLLVVNQIYALLVHSGLVSYSAASKYSFAIFFEAIHFK